MGGGDVGLGDGEVAADHVEGGVPEEALEGEDVHPVAQRLDGADVAEAVAVDAGDAGAQADAVDEPAEDVAGHGQAGRGGDERRERGVAVVAGLEVTPQRLDGARADGHGALAGALAGDGEPGVLEVDGGEAQVAQLAGADAGVEEEEDGLKSRMAYDARRRRSVRVYWWPE